MNQINYPELGGLESKTEFHLEGDEFVHPSGTVYKRINGNWQVISIKEETQEKTNGSPTFSSSS